MRNLSEEIIQFFKENEYIQKVEDLKKNTPNEWAENISDEMQEFFHKIMEFRNRFKD